MDITQLKKDPDIRNAIFEIGDEEHIIIAAKDLQIMVPENYFNGKLGYINELYNVVGYFAVITGDKYAVSLTAAIMPFSPDEVNSVKIDETVYTVMSWSAGSIVCPDRRLPQKPSLSFEIYDELIAKGKLPWYIKRLERAELLYSHSKYANANLTDEHALQSIFCAACDRDYRDLSKYARENFEKQTDYTLYPTSFIPLRSVAYGADSTNSRLVGSYFPIGIRSALVNQTDTLTPIETLSRT